MHEEALWESQMACLEGVKLDGDWMVHGESVPSRFVRYVDIFDVDIHDV